MSFIEEKEGFITNIRHHFERHSFERLGEDLIQLSLSYLSFEDKFRFECLSKQIQKLVFSSITRLKVDNKFQISSDSGLTSRGRVKTLKSVLKKCPNIKSLEILSFTECEEEIDLIINYCNHLNEIHLDFDKLSDHLIEKFCQKFGQKLKKIHFKTNNEQIIKKILKLCPKVEEFNAIMIDFEDLFDENQLLVNNLKSFRFYYSDSDITRMKIIAENNKNSLQYIEVVLAEEVNEKEIREYFGLILELKEIRELKTYFSSDSISVLLEEFIINLSQKCPKLIRLEIDVAFDEMPHILRVFNAINAFKGLKVIKFSNFSRKVSQTSALTQQSVITKSLKDCKHLTDLSIDGNNFCLSEEFFESLVRHSPKVKRIWCSNAEIRDNTVKCFHRLSDLQSISLLTNEENLLSNESLVKLIKNNRKLKSISLSFNAMRCQLRDTDIELLRQSCHSDIDLFSQKTSLEVKYLLYNNYLDHSMRV